jgi:tetratricopeptide (TPR) repeat protein
MRSSSVRAATLILAGFALTVSSASTLGCSRGDQVEPTKLERGSPFDRPGGYNPPGPNDRLRNPATDTPRGRDGEQVSDEQIDAVLAEAAEHAAAGNVAQERNVLRACANKTPASARCDGRMGLSMIESKNRRATALYYLAEAAMVDDPKADAELYLAVGERLRSFGRTDEAIAATQKAVARDRSAATLAALGGVLALVPSRVDEAADYYAEARTLDDRIEWLYEEAVLRGQVAVREQAQRSMALFREYSERAAELPPESLPAPLSKLEARVTELDVKSKAYPTAAEVEQARAQQPPQSSADGEPG